MLLHVAGEVLCSWHSGVRRRIASGATCRRSRCPPVDGLMKGTADLLICASIFLAQRRAAARRVRRHLPSKPPPSGSAHLRIFSEGWHGSALRCGVARAPLRSRGSEPQKPSEPSMTFSRTALPAVSGCLLTSEPPATCPRAHLSRSSAFLKGHSCSLRTSCAVCLCGTKLTS